MIFCKKCGNLMIVQKKRKKLVCVCRNCGYTSRQKKIKTTSISEKLKSDEKIKKSSKKRSLSMLKTNIQKINVFSDKNVKLKDSLLDEIEKIYSEL